MSEGLSIDVRDTTRELIVELGAIEEGITKKASVRAVNRALDRMNTAAGREVRKVYNIKLRAIKDATKIRRASVANKRAWGKLTFSGRPIPLIEFDARWTPNMAGASVKILVGKGRVIRPGSFIATTKRGITGVFQRKGKERYPIKNLRSISIPVAVTKQAVLDALTLIGFKSYRDEFLRQVDLLVKKQNG